MTKLSAIVLTAAVVGLSAPAVAQQQPAPPVGPDFSKVVVKTVDLGNKTYMLEGFGGNVTVAVGEDGVIMVDSQFAPMHDKLKAAIAAITPLPVRYLINTHVHGDHMGGNAQFAGDGAVIVAHENLRKRAAAGWTHNLSGVTTQPAAEAALPKQTYADTATVDVKGRSAKLTHPVNAHTDGDTFVYFADANVLSTGDAFGNRGYPNSDFMNGGNVKGMIAASDTILGMINDQTKIVPGHGPVSGKADVIRFREMMVTSSERMAKLIADGKVKSEAEAQALKPFADLDATWAANEQAGRNWVRVVYNSLKQ
jgi:glyoxylase-like metal-dependent hydrolase (beta-lactamase superfamily II)